MSLAKKKVRKLLKERATFLRQKGSHLIYQLDNGKKVSVRCWNKSGHSDQWKSVLSFLKRKLEEEEVEPEQN